MPPTPSSRRHETNRASLHETQGSSLQEWEHFYNFERPHGALGGQTPYERLRQKTTTPV
jgi:transposase InsO family protein